MGWSGTARETRLGKKVPVLRTLVVSASLSSKFQFYQAPASRGKREEPSLELEPSLCSLMTGRILQLGEGEKEGRT